MTIHINFPLLGRRNVFDENSAHVLLLDDLRTNKFVATIMDLHIETLNGE